MDARCYSHPRHLHPAEFDIVSGEVSKDEVDRVLVGDVDVVRHDCMDGQFSYLPNSLYYSLQNLRVTDFVSWTVDLYVERTDELEGTNVNLLGSDEKSRHMLGGYLSEMKSRGCEQAMVIDDLRMEMVYS